MKAYKVLYEGASAEIVEKKSRFIADVKPVESEAEATAFLESIRKKYWDCRHHCSAFTIGENNEITRCSDGRRAPAARQDVDFGYYSRYGDS